MIVMGIDPGIKGGIVIIRATQGDAPQNEVLLASEMVPYDAELKIPRVDIFENLILVYKPDVIVIEKGGAGLLPSANKLAFATGALVGVASLDEDTIVKAVAPQTWQSKMIKDIDGENTKERAMKAALAYLPDVEMFTDRGRFMDGIADAACIALWYIQKENIK